MGDTGKVTVGSFIVRIKRQGKAINSIMHQFRIVPDQESCGVQYSSSLFRNRRNWDERGVLPPLHRPSKSYAQFKQVFGKVIVKK